MKMKKTFVITWKYGDNTGFGIVGVYNSEAMANAVFKALVNFGDELNRVYEKHEMEIPEAE
jgi:hypothetical protein